MLTIALVGIQNAGKSSVLNSIVHKNIARTGLKKTTTRPIIVGKKLPKSLECFQNNIDFHRCSVKTDNGVELTVIEFPGFTEDSDSFSKIDISLLMLCEVVYWVSDSRTSFTRTTEERLFSKTKDIVSDFEKEGILVEFKILLTKFISTKSKTDESDADYLVDLFSDEIDNFEEVDNEFDEIADQIEDTTSEDIYKILRKNIRSHEIIRFNAFGRSIHNPKSSEMLKDFVSRQDTNPGKENIDFKIKDSEELIKKRQQKLAEYIIESLKVARRFLDDIGGENLSRMIDSINLLTDRESIKNVYDFLINSEITVIVVFCLKYFLKSDTNVFDKIEEDNSKSCLSRAFLIGLDISEGIRDFFAHENHHTMSSLRVSRDKIFNRDNLAGKDWYRDIGTLICLEMEDKPEKIKMFKEYIDVQNEKNYREFCKDEFVDKVKRLRFELFGNDDKANAVILINTRHVMRFCLRTEMPSIFEKIE